jgi:hypothetical protein
VDIITYQRLSGNVGKWQIAMPLIAQLLFGDYCCFALTAVINMLTAFLFALSAAIP